MWVWVFFAASRRAPGKDVKVRASAKVRVGVKVRVRIRGRFRVRVGVRVRVRTRFRTRIKVRVRIRGRFRVRVRVRVRTRIKVDKLVVFGLTRSCEPPTKEQACELPSIVSLAKASLEYWPVVEQIKGQCRNVVRG